MAGINICPHARGFDPHDLTCDLNVAKDRRLPLWRRIVRVFTGRYDCPQFNGELPCKRYSEAGEGKR